MSEANIKIRVKKGSNEVEIEAPASTLQNAIGLITDMMEKIPNEPQPKTHTGYRDSAQNGDPGIGSLQPTRLDIPEVQVDRDESLTSILSKLFRNTWGRTPRKLGEVREVLGSYGLSYPKQSVAVALLRSAQSGKLRRFKGDGGEYVYTASTALATATRIQPEKIRFQESGQYA